MGYRGRISAAEQQAPEGDPRFQQVPAGTQQPPPPPHLHFRNPNPAKTVLEDQESRAELSISG